MSDEKRDKAREGLHEEVAIEVAEADQTIDHSSAIHDLLKQMGRPTSEQTCCLMVIGGMEVGRVVPLEGDRLIAGRDTDCDLVFTDAGTSRRHARLERQGSDYTITDLDSRNGVFVNGARIQEPTSLDDGDKILLGLFTVLKYSRQDALEFQFTTQMNESLSRDALTGVLNRRALDERLSSEWSYAARHGTSLSVLMLDVDHFKTVNDTWGHAVGDAVLKAVAECLQGGVRNEDVCGRYGGEEFVVIARAIGHDGAMLLAERLRRRVEGLVIDHNHESITVTISIGVATAAGGYSASSEVLIALADKRLYDAKNGGRNRSVGD